MNKQNTLEKVYLGLGLLFITVALFYFLEDYLLSMPSIVKGIYTFILAYLLIFYSNIVDRQDNKRRHR